MKADRAGATFLVRLSLITDGGGANQVRRQMPIVKDSTLDCAPVSLRGTRVLVVDDDAAALEILLTILKQCDAEVTACTSAAEALEVIRGWQPHVLVADIAMPDEDG